MAIKNKSFVHKFLVWDTSNNVGKTGDNANITLKIVKDGGSVDAPSNATAEIDAVNLQGWYKITLTAAEMNANSVLIGGESVTADIVVLGVDIITEQGLVALDATVSKEATAAKDATVAKAATVSKEATAAKDATVAKAATVALDATVAKESTRAAVVNAQVLDVMNVDTIAEPAAGAPPAVPTAFEILKWMWMAYRNKVDVTGSAVKVHNNAGTKLAEGSVSDDGTTLTRGELGA